MCYKVSCSLQVLLRSLASKTDKMQKRIYELVAVLKAKPQSGQVDGGAEVKPELGEEVLGTSVHVQSKSSQSYLIYYVFLTVYVQLLVLIL